MVSPIDDVAFLARSETRVGVLRAIEERPRDRRELATATDTPRSTLGRTLSQLEDRGWIERNGRLYETTTAGSLVVEQFLPLLDTVTVLQTLGDGVEFLPLDEADLDVRNLADARLVTPTEMDPTAPFEYGVERLRDADRFRCVALSAPPRYVEAIHEGVMTGHFTAECVLAGAYLDEMRDGDGIAERWQEIAASESTVRRYEGSLSFVVLVLDEIVHLWLCDGEGQSLGLVETENPEILSWANTTVNQYLERAQPIEPVIRTDGS